MKNIEEIITLYEGYQYLKEKDAEKYAVFSLINGIYPAVDILVAEDIDSNMLDNIRKQYSEAGYATNVIQFQGLDNLDETLFKRFFRPDAARKKLSDQYGRYTRNIMSAYQNKDHDIPEYKYIEVGYTYEENFEQLSSNTPLISKLGSMIDGEGARLIIIEAPAGFGKTSTAYELVRYLSVKEDLTRPFLMQLDKDRSASTFRYLLLSQIEQTFTVQLKNNLVIKNIKSGRIPLIIDGFDELLSKDLDVGSKKVNFTEVETMLSTIAELLTAQSKVILTTRKTAIFTGGQFEDWHEVQKDKGRDFSISRIQIGDPSINDWLSKEQIDSLPENIVKVNNPALLSYLRYTPKENYSKFSDAEILAESYFEYLLKREIGRQHLPFGVDIQLNILENVAAYFAALDLTADNRSDISDAIMSLSKAIITQASTPERDEKSLINTLTNHAMFDRRPNGKVGFINDYIYGSLLGWAFLNNREGINLIETLSSRTTDKLIEACTMWNQDKRSLLAEAIEKRVDSNPAILLNVDRFLYHSIKHSYIDLVLSETIFQNILFGKDGQWNGCTFIKCNFNNCILDFRKITECTFISCAFEDITIEGDLTTCNFYEGSPLNDKNNPQEIENHTSSDIQINAEKVLDRLILETFFRSGMQKTRIQHVSTISNILSDRFGKKSVLKRLERMNAQRYLYNNGDVVWMLKSGFDYYKTLVASRLDN